LPEGHGGGSHPPAKRDTKPMKKDTEDVDEDGETDDEVPAYLNKGDTKKKKKKGGKIPPQLQKHVKGKKSKKEPMKEDLGLKNLIRQQIKVALEEMKNES